VIIPMLVVEGMLALSIFGLPRADALAQVNLSSQFEKTYFAEM